MSEGVPKDTPTPVLTSPRADGKYANGNTSPPGKVTPDVDYMSRHPEWIDNPTLKEQADNLVKLNGGKNLVTLRTPTNQIRYDLAGKGHNGVPTPHKQIYIKRFYQGQVRSITRASKNAIPMTQQEIRMIRKFLQGL